jgi:hypothetical protein
MVLHRSPSCPDADRLRDGALLLQSSYCCWDGVLLLCQLNYRGYLGMIKETRTPFSGNILHVSCVAIATDPFEDVLLSAASPDLHTMDHSPTPEPFVNNEVSLIDSCKRTLV